jgi:simple sugar transport system ATP-binding protein
MQRLALETLRKLKINIQDPRESVDNLSGGQQQAVAIGKAVRFNPKVVLMDEPTANLAVREAAKVLDLMISMKNDGIAVVFVTHRLQDIFEVCDRVFILKGGEKVDCRKIPEIDKEEMVKLMFLGKD